MIYKLISSSEIIAKIFADLDIKEENQRISDMLEWVSEAVEKIGAVTQLKRTVSGSDDAPYLQIIHNQAQLPVDLFRLNGLQYSTSITGPWIHMKKSTGTFNSWPSVEPNAVGGDRLIQDRYLVDTVKALYQKYAEDPIYAWFSKMDDAAALEILNTNQNVRTILTNLINQHNGSGAFSSNGLVRYYIKPGYIVTNMQSGFIKISYDALPADENGYLMIPDLASYKEAIYWYVVMKLKYPEYMSGRMNREIYYDMRRSWNFYCKQAYGEAMMPDSGDMENIRNSWLKLMPDIDIDKDSFESLGDSQIIYTH